MSSIAYSDSLSLYLKSFFCSSIPFRSPHYIWLSYLLRILLTVTVLRLALFSMALTVLRRIGRHSSWLDWVMCFYEEDYRSKMPFTSHHIISRIYIMNLIYHCCCWPWSMLITVTFLNIRKNRYKLHKCILSIHSIKNKASLALHWTPLQWQLLVGPWALWPYRIS